VKLARSDGFTLTELLVGLVISLVISTAGWSFYRTQLRALTNQAAKQDATENTRLAMGFMAHEIRQAGYDPAADPDDPRDGALVDGARGIFEARADRLTIMFDANGSGGLLETTEVAGEIVQYRFDSGGSRILRTAGTNGQARTLVRNVPTNGFSLSYWGDENGDGVLDSTAMTIPGPGLSAAQRDAVWLVVITIQVQNTGADNTTTTSTLSSRVALRNRAGVLARL
jgi:prepilin-type N-terminal cleavage/methylation domain-containing protein